MKYICNESGAVFDKIPRVYRGFSGDHFGGGETMLPGCTHCGKYAFSQYTDDENRDANAQLISAAPDLLACLKMALAHIEMNGFGMPRVHEKIMQVIRQAEGRSVNQCATTLSSCQEFPDSCDPATIQPADDPRKQMLDEIRERINNLYEYKSFVRVEGDPVPTLPQIAKWCVIWILDEMEAKL